MFSVPQRLFNACLQEPNLSCHSHLNTNFFHKTATHYPDSPVVRWYWWWHTLSFTSLFGRWWSDNVYCCVSCQTRLGDDRHTSRSSIGWLYLLVCLLWTWEIRPCDVKTFKTLRAIYSARTNIKDHADTMEHSGFCFGQCPIVLSAWQIRHWLYTLS